MSRHLRVLLQAGIVADERPPLDARARVFRLRPESIVAVQAWLDQLQAHGGRTTRVLQAARRTERQEVSDTQSRSSEVEVPVDPVTAFTAFTAFTDELDLW